MTRSLHIPFKGVNNRANLRLAPSEMTGLALVHPPSGPFLPLVRNPRARSSSALPLRMSAPLRKKFNLSSGTQLENTKFWCSYPHESRPTVSPPSLPSEFYGFRRKGDLIEFVDSPLRVYKGFSNLCITELSPFMEFNYCDKISIYEFSEYSSSSAGVRLYLSIRSSSSKPDRMSFTKSLALILFLLTRTSL